MSWRFAKWRIKCHVRSFPPLSSGSSRSDFSQRMRIGECLNTFLVDECAVPELEVQQAPETVTGVGAAGCVIVEETLDCRAIHEPSLAGSAIEQHVSHDAVPSG